ncbi:DNA methyltransferase [Sphingomonas sp.]|uniref:DNA methyltransferase n=1 Tax=Sphingomonas sp. TaxID=28214 RepID=UPI000DB260B9|nr:DNA methyltransferase [Sphingomonas sp.]PZU11439.1 MAG: site-specific DNA-methyltransferase [Sphingomonas sp.]
MSKLFYGDNLEVLRAHVADASVDLIYLDPPFNSNASYNILFRAPNGAGADASIEAFDDTWAWGPAASAALMDITESGNHRLHVLMQAMRTAIGENAMMAYLAMMAVRLVELHRVLKPTGSLYLHCDPTASHYLKLVLDAVFGPENYRNEITWKRTTTHSDSKTWSKITDIILFYTKSPEFIWNTPREIHDEAYVTAKYRLNDQDGRGRYRLDNMTSPSPRPNMMYEWIGFPFPQMGWRYKRETMQRLHDEGRIWYPVDRDGKPDTRRRPQLKRYLEEMAGGVIGSVWTDIPPLNSQAQERLGYPTQKPIALLERIISASSNPGDVVLDPFCGCGTAVDAAQKLGRRWIGIDVTHLAIGLVEKRLRDGYGDQVRFETIGSPRDLASAQRLAQDDPHQFQAWITLRLGGWPWMGGRKGGDKGVDGYFYYVGADGATETGVISVKAGGHINPAMVRDLGRVMQRDGHRLGLFVSASPPTKGMTDEANSHGLIETEFGRYPALQIFTLAELFQDRHPRLPPLVSPHRRAARVETRVSHQAGAQGNLI